MATATQVYTCNGQTIGTFTLTNTYIHGTLSGQAVTNVTTSKQEAPKVANMKKWRMFSFSLLFLLFLIPGFCSAQAPPAIAQSLADEGIGTSHKELLQALHSPIPKIRGMAAGQLAENGDKNAVPALNSALRDERNATERLNIARALTYLGDPRGASAMAKLCADESVPTDLRLMAAGELQEHGNESCFASVSRSYPLLTFLL